MPNIGPLELVVVLIIALVILGPKKLPDVGRSMGRGMREFKSAITGDHDEDDDDLEWADVGHVASFRCGTAFHGSGEGGSHGRFRPLTADP